MQSMSRNSQTTHSLLQVTLVLLAYFWPSLRKPLPTIFEEEAWRSRISMPKAFKAEGCIEVETFLWLSGLCGLASGELAQGVPWILFCCGSLGRGIVGCSGLCKCVSHVIRDRTTSCDKFTVVQLTLRTSQSKPQPWQLRKNGALRIASLQ